MNGAGGVGWSARGDRYGKRSGVGAVVTHHHLSVFPYEGYRDGTVSVEERGDRLYYYEKDSAS